MAINGAMAPRSGSGVQIASGLVIVAAKEEARDEEVPVEEVISMMDDIKARDGHRLSPDKISRLLYLQTIFVVSVTDRIAPS